MGTTNTLGTFRFQSRVSHYGHASLRQLKKSGLCQFTLLAADSFDVPLEHLESMVRMSPRYPIGSPSQFPLTDSGGMWPLSKLSIAS